MVPSRVWFFFLVFFLFFIVCFISNASSQRIWKGCLEIKIHFRHFYDSVAGDIIGPSSKWMSSHSCLFWGKVARLCLKLYQPILSMEKGFELNIRNIKLILKILMARTSNNEFKLGLKISYQILRPSSFHCSISLNCNSTPMEG